MSLLLKRKALTLTLFCILLVFGAIKFYIVSNFEIPLPTPVDPPPTALFKNAELPVEMRITDLISYMTLDEKVGQMALVEKNSIHEPQDIATYGIGALLSGFGAKPEDNTVGGWNVMIDSFKDKAKESRLGIPLFYGVDAIHGHSNLESATIFPHLIGLGASHDAPLVEKVAQATAQELSATGVQWSFSPTLDMPKDIRWGRVYETFSDDPALVAELGAAYVRGLQTVEEATSSVFVLSTPKHYVGAGSMAWDSSSNKNFRIDQGTTLVNEEALRSTYLPPFSKAIEEGALSIMVGLNSWGDEKLSANEYLVTKVLKEELGFKGFTVSDWYGVYEIKGGDYKAAVTAINAGIDMVMLPFDYKTFVTNVTWAVRKGDIEEARIDDAVRRILRAKFALGLFDEASKETSADVVGSEAHRELAREAVSKSLVLLKNDADVLPLKALAKKIHVAGSAADNVGKQSGAWTVEWQGIDGNWLPQSTSILAGIKEEAGAGTQIFYDVQGNFKGSAELADIGIAVVGEAPYAEGWGDKDNPALSEEDLRAIENLKNTSKKVVVILVSGRPLFITDELPKWDAVVAAWLPGSEGAGVADVLFGKKPFSGSLPLPWPAHFSQLPIAQDGATADKTPLLFPRYFGLK